MRTVLAAIAVIAMGSSAQAYCPSVPDTEATSYVENSLNRTLCLQRELAAATASRAAARTIDATLGKLQRDALQQRLKLQQLQARQLLDRLKAY